MKVPRRFKGFMKVSKVSPRKYKKKKYPRVSKRSDEGLSANEKTLMTG